MFRIRVLEFSDVQAM